MLTLSDSKGTGGKVKSSPDDFIVKEITSKGHILNPDQDYTAQELGEQEDLSGKFTTFILQKKGWETVNSLIRISKLTGHGKKSISYAGTKDKQSISTQLAAIYGVDPERMMGVRLKDVWINGAWKSNGVELGSNIGNSFTVVIKGCKATKPMEETMSQIDSKAPNYFDRQRFGMRLNNFSVGMSILKGDFKEAVMDILTNTNLETNEEAKEARKRFAKDQDYIAALQYFPKHLRSERTIIEYMSKYDNPANALRKLPRGILMMFVHSVQSLMFNAALEARIKEKDFKSPISCKKNFYGFPDIDTVDGDGDFPLGSIVGYETKPEHITDYDRKVLKKFDIKQEDFKIKQMPELSMRGSFRNLLMPVKDLSFSAQGKDITVDFSIPSGSYATILLNEITKSDGLELSDITKA